MADPETLKVERDAGVATLVVNRPETHNALDVDMLDQLPEILHQLSEDDSVRCVVITGAGDRAFCAGGDISGVGDSNVPDPEALVNQLERWSQASVLLHEMPKPTLAVVNGTAAGAGMALALACDLRAASESARFITAFSKLAMSGDFGGSYFLTRLVGPAKAREFYFLSEQISSAEALTLGLANWVVEGAALREFAHAKAVRLAAMPPLTYRNMKRNLIAAENQPLADVVRLEAESMIETALSDETRVAATSFLTRKRNA